MFLLLAVLAEGSRVVHPAIHFLPFYLPFAYWPSLLLILDDLVLELLVLFVAVLNSSYHFSLLYKKMFSWLRKPFLILPVPLFKCSIEANSGIILDHGLNVIFSEVAISVMDMIVPSVLGIVAVVVDNVGVLVLLQSFVATVIGVSASLTPHLSFKLHVP